MGSMEPIASAQSIRDAEAAWFADTVVLLRDGRIVQQGPARTLLDAPADDFVAAFMRAQRGVDEAAR